MTKWQVSSMLPPDILWSGNGGFGQEAHANHRAAFRVERPYEWQGWRKHDGPLMAAPDDDTLNALRHNTAARNERSTTGYGYQKLAAGA